MARVTAVSQEALECLDANDQHEERLLRIVDQYRSLGPQIAQRWVSVAATHFEQGFMALNRAIINPGRTTLPEDEVKDQEPIGV